MGVKRRSLTGGEVFGYLTVEGLSHSCKRKDGTAGERVMNCVCKCGSKVKVRTSNLYSGNTNSCGCFKKERTVLANIARGESPEFVTQQVPTQGIRILGTPSVQSGEAVALRNYVSAMFGMHGWPMTGGDHRELSLEMVMEIVTGAMKLPQHSAPSDSTQPVELPKGLKALCEQGEDYIRRPAKAAVAYIENIRAIHDREQSAAFETIATANAEISQLRQQLAAAQPSVEGQSTDRDTYALKEAQRLWALPEMPKSQLVSLIQLALLDAMTFAAPAAAPVALIGERDRLRKLCGELYQVLGCYDAPLHVLDQAAAAANGAPLPLETLLPFIADDYEKLLARAEELATAVSAFREAFVIAVGDKSPFAKIALNKIDAALANTEATEGK